MSEMLKILAIDPRGCSVVTFWTTENTGIWRLKPAVLCTYRFAIGKFYRQAKISLTCVTILKPFEYYKL